MSVRDNVVIILRGGVPIKAPTRRSPARHSGRVTFTQVNAEVWKKALEVAGGDKSRLRIVSETEVVVLNGSR